MMAQMYSSGQRFRRLSRPVITVVAALVATLLVIGCTRDGLLPTPTTDDPQRAAAELAAGLAKGDLTAVEFLGADGSLVQAAYEPLVAGMGPLLPQVRVVGVERDGADAAATLETSWRFPGIDGAWTYSSVAKLRDDAGRWKTIWQPLVAHPQLDGSNRLTQRRLAAARGELLGDDDDAIVQLRGVVRIGIDRSSVTPDVARRSAARLARLVDIDRDAYVEEVAEAGPEAFVEAIVLRAEDEDRPENEDVFAIPGALPIEDEQMLAPTRDFARPVIGIVGEATAEIVRESDGAVVAGDQVGLSGLQRRYDEQLRGTPGVQVRLVAAEPGANPAPPAGGSGSPGPSGSPRPGGSPGPSASPRPEVTVFQIKPVAGEPLRTTLNVYLQELAEEVLEDVKPASAIVAVRPSNGAVVAAANGAGTNGQSIATVGQAAPGSTFKIVTSLALIRAGLEPSSRVRCPATLTVDGRRFRNYSDYPASQLGTITLQTALAQSCNTAFIGARGELGDQALAEAAASLGLGVDYDVGFASFFGSVPEAKSETGRAAAMIGQGTVQASPLVMAAVAASVAGGRTVLPELVAGTDVEPKGKPLTDSEADALQDMMAAVVTQGSGRFLADQPGSPVLAKTGTAEYGDDSPLRTHAWMIAAQDDLDLAVAVFVNDGESGSRTAGPLLEEFLRGAR